MTFMLHDRWVWDFWLAPPGGDGRHHLYYLSAPKSLGDPDLRHRNATIGHAVSDDLVSWSDLGTALSPGDGGSFDGSATWTGSIVQAPDGTWCMFYTGSRFLSPDSSTNVETIGLATSRDLHEWVKQPDVVVSADPRWYEVLADETWREEAWRDPWVYEGRDGQWHMLVTARSRSGSAADRGVIGHAVSSDLRRWIVTPPVSDSGAGFMHLEVPQLVEVQGRWALLFSCDSAHIAGARAAKGEAGGIWAVSVDDPTAPFDTAKAVRLTGDNYYSGRAVQGRDGSWSLLAFENVGTDGEFVGRLSDPLSLEWDSTEHLTIRKAS